jgi:carbamoyl-phosphate synthase large subunit
VQLNFLITGCHGDIAFSIASIIRKHFKKIKLIGTDVETNGIGNLLFDNIYKVPLVSDKKYVQTIFAISKSVDLIIPSTENEIIFFARNIKKFKNKILINNPEIINLFSNKLRTQKFLRKNFKDLSLKFSVKLSDYLDKKLNPPFFLKKKSGSGNQNYKIIKNKKDIKNLKYYKKNNWVVEELLDPNLEEYTCAIIKLKEFKKIIIFKRKLHKMGHTMFIENFHNIEIEKKLFKIADKIDLNGSINIQFKIHNNQIKIFDINPRLSSTLKLRHLIGFQDCLWWINDKINIKEKKKVKLKKFKYAVKYFDEKIIF